MCQINLRAATGEDVYAISSLIQQNFDFVDCPDSRKRIYRESNLPENLLKNHFTHEKVSVIVAEIGQKLIGVLVYDLESNDVVHFRKCHVAPDFRRRGVSLSLFGKAIAEAKLVGVNSFFSKIIPESLDAVVAVMAKSGITLTEVRKNSDDLGSVFVRGTFS